MRSPTSSRHQHPNRNFDTDCFKASLIVARYIVTSYSTFIGKNSLGEHFVCDESVLPHPKKVIKSAYKLWIEFIAQKEDVDRCMIQFPLLAQFQKNIGRKPVKLVDEPPTPANIKEDKTLLLQKKPSSKLISDMGLIKQIFDERGELERFLHHHLRKSTVK